MRTIFLDTARRLYKAIPFRPLRARAFELFQRMVSNSRRITTIDGCQYDLDLGEVIDLNIYLRNFEREVVEGLRSACRPGMTVIDIGANIGAHCLPLAHQVGPTGRVYAFEPTDFAYAKLSRNLALNPGHVVTAVKAALSEVTASAQRIDFRSSWRTDGSRKDGESIVDFIRLDDWASANGVGHVDLIKIDIDGNEFGALLGGMRLITASKPLMFMEAVFPHFADEARNPFHLLEEIGYRFWDAKSLRMFASPAEIRAALPEGDHAMTRSINVVASVRPLAWHPD